MYEPDVHLNMWYIFNSYFVQTLERPKKMVQLFRLLINFLFYCEYFHFSAEHCRLISQSSSVLSTLCIKIDILQWNAIRHSTIITKEVVCSVWFSLRLWIYWYFSVNVKCFYVCWSVVSRYVFYNDSLTRYSGMQSEDIYMRLKVNGQLERTVQNN